MVRPAAIEATAAKTNAFAMRRKTSLNQQSQPRVNGGNVMNQTVGGISAVSHLTANKNVAYSIYTSSMN